LTGLNTPVPIGYIANDDWRDVPPVACPCSVRGSTLQLSIWHASDNMLDVVPA